MSAIEDGGPAFPATNYIIPRDLEERHVAALGKTQGMTLRDYFAAKAMQATITALAGWGPLEFLRDIDTDKVAEFASKQADAMLAAREAQP